MDINQSVGVRFFQSQDQRQGGPAPEFCAPTYVAYISGSPPLTCEGHDQFGQVFYTGFPDMRHYFNEVVAENNTEVVHFTLKGTHTGNFAGIPPTGRAVTISATGIFHLDNGKVAELYGTFDRMGLMQQLGVIPA